MTMKSKLADQLRREREERDAALTPEERILQALALGDRDLRLFMAATGLPLDEARRQLVNNKRRGRASKCAADR